MKKIILTLNFVSLLTWAAPRELPYFENKELTPYWLSDKKDYAPAKVDEFKAINQDGKIIDQNQFKNHLSLVNFFFVSCPGICPMMMKNVLHLQKTLGPLQDQVHIYSFSVQPKNDNPEMLRGYAKTYKINLKNWTLLTGEQKILYHVGKDMFKADGAVGEQKSPDSFIHTQNIYLVDQSLHIRGIYNTSDNNDMKQLTEDIKILNQVEK